MYFPRLSLVLCLLQKDWEDGYRLAAAMNFRWPQCIATNLKTAVPNASSEGLNVMKDLIQWNPKDRPTAIQVRKTSFILFYTQLCISFKDLKIIWAKIFW